MALDEIWNGGVRFLLALDVRTQAVLAVGGIIVCLYLIKRLTTPAERR